MAVKVLMIKPFRFTVKCSQAGLSQAEQKGVLDNKYRDDWYYDMIMMMKMMT